MRKYIARKNPDGSYRVLWGQQTEIKALNKQMAKDFCHFRNKTIDSRGFETLDDPLTNEELLEQLKNATVK